MKARNIILTFFLSGVVVSVSATIPATAADTVERSRDGSRYSDRDMVRDTKDEKEQLEKALKTGEEKEFYRRELEKAGFMITAVNYDKPDYVEYEVVKGKNSYEVQIDFDKNSHKAKNVDVAFNAWQTEATERALGQNKKVAFPRGTTPNAERYSERDRARSSKDEERQLEQALKTGESKEFYQKELEKMGWKITSVNYDKSDYAEFEVVKGQQSYEVQIDFDKNSHKAKKIDVVTNIWRADATKRALSQTTSTQARR
ncbi:MAG TPA: hypothetical protein VIH18_32860 [Candidatus Binatia bacterium]